MSFNYTLKEIKDLNDKIFKDPLNNVLKESTSPRKLIISIEGNIGVGKSSFLTMLKQKLASHPTFKKGVEFVYEPVNEWLSIKDKDGVNLLDTFYKDKNRWSYTFQNIAYITRMNRLIEAIKKDENQIIILDRSLNADLNTFSLMLHEEGAINDIEWSAYQLWNDFYQRHFGKDIPHHVVYLRCDPVTAYNRIHLRNREEESTIPLDYLKDLHRYHDRWLIYRDDTTIIDADKDFVKNGDYFEELFSKVEKIITKYF